MLPFDIKYAIIGAALLASFVTGWVVHGWKYDANLKSALQEKIELQASFARQARALVAKFDKQQAEQVIVYRDIKRKVPNVTDNRICFNDSDALSVWNSALTGDVPKATAGATKAPTSANTATNTEVLANAVENFEQAKQIRDQLNALIDWYEGTEKK